MINIKSHSISESTDWYNFHHVKKTLKDLISAKNGLSALKEGYLQAGSLPYDEMCEIEDMIIECSARLNLVRKAFQITRTIISN